jgi:hypothetical protein
MMTTKQRKPRPEDRSSQDKLLERIARRYEQLDAKLLEIEARLVEADRSEESQSASPRKPR